MKLVARISSIILLLLLVLVPTIALSSDQKYPEFINGKRVILVQNSENTRSLDTNLVILTVLDDDSNSIEESMAEFSDYLGNYQLPEGWSITVIGGPGASAEECLRVHNSFNEAVEKSGIIRLSPIQSFASSESSESTTLGHWEAKHPSFALDGPEDPGFPYYATIKYIAAEWIAPVVGTEQSTGSYLLVNGLTDTGYFMQSGQWYDKYGFGEHIWCDSTTLADGRGAEPFGIEYVPGHECWHAIAWFASGWDIAMSDVTAGVWAWHWDHEATGTKLRKDYETSVWFENWNYDSNWYEGFNNSNTPTISVYKAYDGLSYPTSIHQWYGDYQRIIYWNGVVGLPLHGEFTGRLQRGATATWHLDKLPLAEAEWVP